jgi:hypothetical protein
MADMAVVVDIIVVVAVVTEEVAATVEVAAAVEIAEVEVANINAPLLVIKFSNYQIVL